MPRTVSVAPPSPDRPDDLAGGIVDGIEALRQRIVQAIRWRLGTWYLASRSGLDYDRLIGHRLSPDLVAATLNGVIRTEGGDEVLGVTATYDLDRPSRVFTYAADVQTIYGPMAVEESLP